MKKSTRVLGFVLIAAMVIGAVQTIGIAQDDSKKAKHNIKQVMAAHKKGAHKKVISGAASQEEKLALLDLYISLVENEPPQGDIDSWHRLAGGAALAAAKVVVGRDGALAELKAATNCAACHKVHKPK